MGQLKCLMEENFQMTDYSFKSYATRERIVGDRTPLLTVQHGHALNNDHRAPFASGVTAARALLVHAQRELSDPVRGPEYFSRLRQMYDSATINGQRVKQRLRQRQARAASALANSDVELTAEQLQIVADIAMVQAEIGQILLPEVTASGLSSDAVIDQIDTITRTALRSATFLRTEQQIGEEVDPNAWSRKLAERLNSVPGVDPSENASMARAQLVISFSELVFKLEASLPLAIDRDEPLYEIDDALDPNVVAATRDRLSAALGEAYNPNDLDQDEVLTDQAKQAIYQSMSMDEREFAATKIALTPGQRIEVGMQIVNSTPPVIRLPEAELAQGRFNVRMATEEEARVMSGLLRYAGETLTYPGPEQAAQHIENMKELSMTAGILGRSTVGIAVANNPASIAHAEAFIAKVSTASPEVRLIIHADNPQVAAQLQETRSLAMSQAGHEAKFNDGSIANRDFGGWTLPDNGADVILGAEQRDAAIFVANTDKVWVYNNTNDLEIGSMSAALDEITRTANAARATENDLKNAREAMENSRDQKLVMAAQDLANKGMDYRDALVAANQTANPKLVAEYERRNALFKTSVTAARTAERRYETMQRQNDENAHRISSPGDLARATIVDLSQQQGKLAKVYVPSKGEQGAVIETRGGSLIEQRPFVAQQKAQRLRNGDSVERGNMRRLFHAERGVNSVLIDGSNFYKEDKGAQKGFAVLRDRIEALSKTATILTSNNNKNAISAEVVNKLGRPVLHATAWRVSDHSRPIGIDGRTVTLSERKTELDLGFVGYQGQKLNPETRTMEDAELARPREWAYKDLKGAVVVVTGGGSMSRDTYDAIQALAAEKGLVGHSLSNQEIGAAYNELLARGNGNLEAPKFANDQLARAIMQEAVIDYAQQVEIASDMGKDYHSSTLIRLAADADKLASVTDKEGNAVPIQAAYDHSLQYAHSIADNTRKDLDLSVSAQSEFGQLVLTGLPNIGAQRAALIGENYNTLGDVMRAAEANEASAALPRSVHNDLARPNTWAAAFDRAGEIEKYADRGMMDAISATNPMYPKTLKNSGRSDMLYTMGEVDLNTPTLAMVIGGNSKPLQADVEAARAVAIEAREKGWAVSIHLSGETSAEIAKAIAKLPEAERPQILLVGDGHPATSGNPKILDAFSEVGNAGGAYITATAPTPLREDKETGQTTYKADRRTALEIQGRQASAMVVVKSSGNDVEMLALRAALNASVPVAAIGPSSLVSPTVDDLRFKGSGYSANQRLLAGGNSVSVMLETRHLSFQPNFIPDMTAQTENRYIPFEGSTAGMQNAPDAFRQQEQEIDNSAIETSGRATANIVWKERAEYIPDGRGTGDFLTKVEEGTARDIAAKEADISAMARENDMRFLDTSYRLNAANDVKTLNTRADVADIFNEVNDRSQEAIDLEAQQHFMAQRSGIGR